LRLNKKRIGKKILTEPEENLRAGRKGAEREEEGAEASSVLRGEV